MYQDIVAPKYANTGRLGSDTEYIYLTELSTSSPRSGKEQKCNVSSETAGQSSLRVCMHLRPKTWFPSSRRRSTPQCPMRKVSHRASPCTLYPSRAEPSCTANALTPSIRRLHYISVCSFTCGLPIAQTCGLGYADRHGATRRLPVEFPVAECRDDGIVIETPSVAFSL